MDVVEALHKIIDYNTLLKHYNFDKIRSDGEMIRACCKIHGGNNSTAFVVNNETKLWFCHTGGCGGGDAIKLVRILDECTFKEAVNKLAGIFGLDTSNMKLKKVEPKYSIKDIPVYKKPTPLTEFKVEVETKNILKFRKFLPSTIEHFGLKFVERIGLVKRNGEPYTLKDRLLFPIIQNGIQVGVSLRKIHGKDYPKWSHQPVNLPTKELLYNYDGTKDSTVIVVCEGILDVWAYHEIGVKAVATFGAHITDQQYQTLLKTGTDLVLSFDGDNAGRIARNKAVQIFRNKCTLYDVNFANGEDPENISREELKTRYANKKRI